MVNSAITMWGCMKIKCTRLQQVYTCDMCRKDTDFRKLVQSLNVRLASLSSYKCTVCKWEAMQQTLK